MNSQTLGLRVAGTVFGLMCLIQLARLVARTEVLVAGRQLPFWLSALAVVFAGGLSLWMWKLALGRQGGSQIRNPNFEIRDKSE